MITQKFAIEFDVNADDKFTADEIQRIIKKHVLIVKNVKVSENV